jgi:hypothetical protein
MRLKSSLPFPKSLGVLAMLLLTACGNPGDLDWDLRAGQGSLDTSEAARAPTANRPSADGRGIILIPAISWLWQIAVIRSPPLPNGWA